jgi:hypothetical protein
MADAQLRSHVEVLQLANARLYQSTFLDSVQASLLAARFRLGRSRSCTDQPPG